MADLSDAAVHHLTAAILARPEFAQLHAKLPFWVEWGRRFHRWLMQFALLRESAPVFYWLIFTSLLIAIVGLLAHIVWTLRAALIAPGLAGPDAPLARASPDLVREARALAASERYLEAAHRLMIASFQALAEHAVIELRPDRSNRWIRGALRDSTLAAKVSEELERLVVQTERLWFGSRLNDPGIYADWLGAWERLAVELR